MLNSKKITASVLLFLATAPQNLKAAGFIEDSHGTLMFRNFYFDRDYKGETNVSARREWAIKSGFTEGPVGFGLDLQGMWGVKLDSSRDRTGTNLLPVDRHSGKAQDEYAELGLTGKLRYSQTELYVGTVAPQLPILISSPARLLWQTFKGGYLQSKDIQGLTLHSGYLNLSLIHI